MKHYIIEVGTASLRASDQGLGQLGHSSQQWMNVNLNFVKSRPCDLLECWLLGGVICLGKLPRNLIHPMYRGWFGDGMETFGSS